MTKPPNPCPDADCPWCALGAQIDTLLEGRDEAERVTVLARAMARALWNPDAEAEDVVANVMLISRRIVGDLGDMHRLHLAERVH